MEEETKNKRIGVRITPSLRARIDEQCKETKSTISEIVEKALINYFGEEK